MNITCKYFRPIIGIYIGHLSLEQQNQDPGAFDDHFAGVVRAVLEVRYALLPLLYTLFYESHMNGAPVARGMFYEYVQHLLKTSIIVHVTIHWVVHLFIISSSCFGLHSRKFEVSTVT